jgi:shikimate kinase
LRRSSRPLLDVQDPDARARALYAEREPIYKAAGTVILTDGRPLAEVVAHVIRVWRRESQEFARGRAIGGG